MPRARRNLVQPSRGRGSVPKVGLHAACVNAVTRTKECEMSTDPIPADATTPVSTTAEAAGTDAQDASQVANAWLQRYAQAAAAGEAAGVAELFEEEGFWRDLVAMT